MISNQRRIGAAVCALLAWASPAHATKNTGVAPTAVVLPKGPGSVQGLGGAFVPDLNTGTARHAITLRAVAARGESLPPLRLEYDAGFPNGAFGLGWRLSLPWIQRSTASGLPQYRPSDRFSTDQEERLIEIERSGPRQVFRSEVERRFVRYTFRAADDVWVAELPDGTKQFFGEGPFEPSGAAARIADGPRVFAWLPSRFVDRNGNEVQFRYEASTDSPGIVYLSEVRYNIGARGHASISMVYSLREDPLDDYQAGFLRRVGRLCTAIAITATVDGRQYDVRHYRLEYRRPNGLSLLTALTEFGSDGKTALPALRLSYSSAAEPAALRSMANAPPGGAVVAGSAEVYDLNGDGFPDILHTATNDHSWYRNLGGSEWAPRALLASSHPVRLTNQSVDIGDMDGDARPDLVVKQGIAGGFRYYPRDAAAGWKPPVEFHGSPFAFSLADPNVRLLDLNHDRRIDVMFTSSRQTWSYWINEGVGADGQHRWAFASGPSAAPMRFADGLQLADLNGDGLVDLVTVRSVGVSYWPNRGNGAWGPTQTLADVPDLASMQAAARLSDVTGDGLADLLLVTSGRVRFWPNLGGRSLGTERRVEGTGPLNADTTVRIIDVNANGSLDILWVRRNVPEGEQFTFVDLLPVKPNLLESIDNSMGSLTTIHYETSSQQADAARIAGLPWRDHIPVPVHVVSRVTVFDRLTATASDQRLTYRDGFFGESDRRFWGFGEVSLAEGAEAGAAARSRRYVFNPGRDASARESRWHKGSLEREETLDDAGRVLRRRAIVSELHELWRGGDDRVAALLPRTESVVHLEGQQLPVEVSTGFQHDEHGNIIETRRSGRTDRVGDERVERAEYRPLTSAVAWMLRFPVRVWTTEIDGTLVRDEQFEYDDLPAGSLARGNVTAVRQRLDPDSSYVTVVQQRFDGWGNVTVRTNGRGNARRFSFDDIFHLYPTRESIRVGGYDLELEAEYDPGSGQMLRATDFRVGGAAVAERRYTYDALGRLSAVLLPGDPADQPTTRHSYVLGERVSYIETQQRTGDDPDTVTREYVDGFGRAVGQLTRDADGRWIARNVRLLNGRGLAHKEWFPLAMDGDPWRWPEDGLRATAIRYDALDREIERTHPDGAFTSIAYEPLTEHRSDERDNAANPGRLRPFAAYTSHEYDGLERLSAVVERAGTETFRTVYEYNAADNLTRAVDALGNVRESRFDAMGRRIYSGDPDTGERWFQYDLAGNVTRMRDARGVVVVFDYDGAERLVAEAQLAADGARVPLVRYEYDIPPADAECDADPGTAAGRLVRVHDGAGSECFAYDALGHVSARTRTVPASGHHPRSTFILRQRFDRRSRLMARTQPNGEVVTYRYEPRGELTAVAVTGGRSIIDAIEYEASGAIGTIKHGNGVEERLTYDGRDRLAGQVVRSSAGTLHSLTYAYDPASNVVRREVAGPGSSTIHQLAYDDLHRLTRFRSSSGAQPNVVAEEIGYRYDAIGNLIAKSAPRPGEPGHFDRTDDAGTTINLGALGYGGAAGRERRGVRRPDDPAGPHSVTATDSGRTYTYDARGNVISGDSFEWSWSAANRLERVGGGGMVVRFAYDYLGRRVSKEVETAAGSTRILFPFEFVESRATDHLEWSIFAGARRVAAGGNTADLRHYHTDNLSSTILTTDATGATVSAFRYYPDGLMQESSAAASRASSYLFNGKALDDETQMYDFGARVYHPVIGQFLSADPLYGDVDTWDPTAREEALRSPGRLNLYAFANRNPLRYADPTGLDAIDTVQRTLDGVGLIPGIGEAADLTNAAISLARGQYAEAALSAAAMVPLAGSLATGAKTARRLSETSQAVVKYDPAFAARQNARQILGEAPVTPGGREISVHAARRMTNPAPGRQGMSKTAIDRVLDEGDRITKVDLNHPLGPTVTIQHTKMPGQPRVVVDAATGRRVVTVIQPKTP